jgi:predicted membrane chloride channel (bestrophin family)
MNSQQSGMMMACGLLVLMILCMFSSCIAVFIFAIFGLQESSLGPLTLASMVGLIGLVVYMTHRSDENYKKRWEQYDIEQQIKSNKRDLIYQATDFSDSRKSIAQRAKWDLKSKSRRHFDEDDCHDDYNYDYTYSDAGDSSSMYN